MFVKGHYDTVSGFTSCQFNVCPWSFTARCGSHREECGQDCALAIISIIIRWPITSQQNAHSVFIQTYLWHVILPQDFRLRLIPLSIISISNCERFSSWPLGNITRNVLLREVLQHNFLQPVVHVHSEAVPDVKMEFPPQTSSNFTLILALFWWWWWWWCCW